MLKKNSHDYDVGRKELKSSKIIILKLIDAYNESVN